MSLHETPQEVLTNYLLAKIDAEAPEKALTLYRSIAATHSNQKLATRCTKLADQLETLQRAQMELRLDYQRGTL